MTTTPAGPLRSIAAQTLDELGGRGSLLVEQRLDHAVLDQLMGEAKRADSPLRFWEAVTELSRRAREHAAAEEMVLLPACRTHLGEAGEALIADAQARHREITGLLDRVTGRNVDDQARADLALACALIGTDAREEEDVLLPQLQAVLDVAALRALGADWQAARGGSPVRASAPSPPPRDVPRLLIGGLVGALIAAAVAVLVRRATRH